MTRLVVKRGRGIPLVSPGQQVSASEENAVRQVVRDLVTRAPESQDSGDDADASARTLTEVSRTTQTVRIYQDGDTTSANYVDVQRVLTMKLRDSLSGELWTLSLNN